MVRTLSPVECKLQLDVSTSNSERTIRLCHTNRTVPRLLVDQHPSGSHAHVVVPIPESVDRAMLLSFRCVHSVRASVLPPHHRSTPHRQSTGAYSFPTPRGVVLSGRASAHRIQRVQTSQNEAPIVRSTCRTRSRRRRRGVDRPYNSYELVALCC